MTTLCRRILSAVEKDEIEAVAENGQFRILIDQMPVIAVYSDPYPTVEWTGTTEILIKSGHTIIQRIQADGSDDAQAVATIVRDFFAMMPVEIRESPNDSDLESWRPNFSQQHWLDFSTQFRLPSEISRTV